jgi:hypothetical protein
MSQPFSSEPQKQLPEELKSRLYEQFDSLTRNFKVTFGALVLFGLIFFYLIFAPVVEINHSRAEILKGKIDSDKNFEISTKLMLTVQLIEYYVKKMESGVNNIPNVVEKFVSEVKAGGGKLPGGLKDITGDLCKLTGDSISYVACLTQTFLASYYCSEIKIFADSISIEAREIKDKFQDAFDTTSFRNLTKDILAKLNTIVETRGLYVYANGKLALADNLRDFVKGKVLDISKEVRNLVNVSRRTIEKEKIKQDSLNTRLEFLKMREMEISTKIDKINSPLGSIPVSLRESMEIFPLLLSVGMVLSLFLFLNILSVREKFIRDYLKPLYPQLNDSDFSVTMPVILNPSIGLKHQLMPLIFILMPLFVFGSTVLATAFVWDDLRLLSKYDNREIWIYQEVISALIYLGCTIVYIISYRQLLMKFSWRTPRDRRRADVNAMVDLPKEKDDPLEFHPKP